MDPVLMCRLSKPLLFLAAFIWGTSFFIMKNTLDAVPVLWLLTFRFTTGAVLVGLLCGRKWRTRFTPDYVWRGAVLGSLLFAAYAVQTFGLVGTTPSKNAFLTATYCVLVPFLHWAVSRQRPDRFHLLAAFLCITGVGLVSLNGSLTITWGDLLSLGSALFYALHIVAVNKLSDRRDIYLLTSLQFAFTALLAVIGGLLDDQKTYNQSEVPGLGSIPVLGWLFKSRNKKSTQTNLFIFITPKVIRNAADSADLTREKQLVLHETSVGHDGLGLPIMSKPKLLKPVFVN